MEPNAQFCLRWNNYQRTIATSLDALRVEGDFVDVTLACEGSQLHAHRMVLSACSPFFRQLLKANPHPHPIVILRDVSRHNMALLLDFMYHGQVNVAQEQLPEFLKVAELLKVKGLAEDKRGAESTPAPPNGQSAAIGLISGGGSPPGPPSEDTPPMKRPRQHALAASGAPPPPLLPASPAPSPQYDPSAVKREAAECDSGDSGGTGVSGGPGGLGGGSAATLEERQRQESVGSQQAAEVTIEETDPTMPSEASRGHQPVGPGPSAYEANVDPLSLVCHEEPGPSSAPPTQPLSPPLAARSPVPLQLTTSGGGEPLRLTAPGVGGLSEPLQCCPHCPAVFSSKSTIKDHVARVHFPVPVHCPLCGKLCANQGVLRVHRSRVHRHRASSAEGSQRPSPGPSTPH